MSPDDDVRVERLEDLIANIESEDEDLAEFFEDEFAGCRSMLHQVLGALRDALVETRNG